MLAELVRGLAADDDLVDEVLRAARGAGAATRSQVAAVLAAGFDTFLRAADTHDPELGFPADFSQATRFGAEQAALGVPVAGLIAGVHAGRSRLLEIAVDRGRAAGIPDDALLRGLLKLERYGRALEHHMVGGHRSAASRLDRDDRAARIRVLRRVLLGDTTAPDDYARFGLRDDRRYHYLTSDEADPSRVRALEQAVTRCGGLLAPVDGRLAGLTPRLPPGLAPLPAVIVATPPVPLSDAPAAHRLGEQTLYAAHSAGLSGLCRVTDLATETALAAQPLLAEMLSTELLGALDPADDFHRQLASTALAYLDRGRRLDQTAETLHLHPNTVRYRLRRLGELTGFTEPASLTEAVRWWWALRCWCRRRSSLDRR
ncbi:helix-turn-helix domain-containing protein [Actinoplanes sp. NPDC049596]|uniref:helix-turn-helix domain-containing protein n=1 Tax=unclassified Actinoplanes TaxID=2626549 RepID=UPI00343FC34B